MGYNLENRSCDTQYISEKKWESRLSGERYVPSSDSNQEFARPPIKPNKCKYFSKEMIKYINLQSALCPKCKELGITKRCSRDHLDIFHQIKINSIDEISDHLNKNSQKKVVNEWGKKVSRCKNRQEMIQAFKEIFEPNYNKIKRFFGLIKA